MLGAFHDRRIHPLISPSREPLDFSRDAECDALCVVLANEPEMELHAVDGALLRLLSARIRFAIAAANAQPSAIIGHVLVDAPDDLVLGALLGVQVRTMRVPDEWRTQAGSGTRRQ